MIAFLASANVDPAQFPDPETFNIQRSPNQQLTFGRGIHTCLGLRLAHLETQIAWQRLFMRHPNVHLALNQQPVPWNARIGMRTLSQLPIQLNLS